MRTPGVLGDRVGPRAQGGRRRRDRGLPDRSGCRTGLSHAAAPSAAFSPLTSSELTEPVRPAAKASTIRPSAQPLCPAADCSAPASAASGSVVGLPSASTAQPRGIASPAALAMVILPCATAEIKRNPLMQSAGPSGPGIVDRPNGVCAMDRRLPSRPARCQALGHAIAITSASAILSVEIAPVGGAWCANGPRKASQPRFPAPPRSACGRARANAGCAKPKRASTRTQPGAGSETSGSTVPLTRPLCSCTQ